MLSGPGGRGPPGMRPTSGRPPDVGDRPGLGCEPGYVYWDRVLDKSVCFRLDDVRFSQDHYPPPPLLHSLNGPKGP